MKNLLFKIRGLPERERKIIFWAVIIVLALALSSFYIKNVQKKVADVGLEKTKEELQIDSLEEIFEKIPKIEIPKIEMPEIDQETLQELEGMMEEMPEEKTTENTYREPVE